MDSVRIRHDRDLIIAVQILLSSRTVRAFARSAVIIPSRYSLSLRHSLGGPKGERTGVERHVIRPPLSAKPLHNIDIQRLKEEQLPIDSRFTRCNSRPQGPRAPPLFTPRTSASGQIERASRSLNPFFIDIVPKIIIKPHARWPPGFVGEGIGIRRLATTTSLSVSDVEPGSEVPQRHSLTLALANSSTTSPASR